MAVPRLSQVPLALQVNPILQGRELLIHFRDEACRGVLEQKRLEHKLPDGSSKQQNVFHDEFCSLKLFFARFSLLSTPASHSCSQFCLFRAHLYRPVSHVPSLLGSVL